jgi:N-acetylglucosaminyl-diphospho-decaprenol L-rhamnosyltransferase
MDSYSMVVVTWQSAATLEKLIATMNRHLESRPELIVVDNGSDDDPERTAGEYRGETRFISLEENLGYGAACNVGVEAAAGSAVVMLNPDIELLDSSLDGLVAFAAQRRALAGPLLLNSDRSIQPSAWPSSVGAWPWIGALLPGALQPRPLQERLEPWRAKRAIAVAWFAGACMAAPREVLLRLGPFDPAIHLYSEDLDLGLRAERAGIPAYFCPDVCRVVHHGGASASIAFPEGAYELAARNRRAVLRRAYGARREHAAWLALRLNLGLRVLAKRALGRDSTRQRALLDAVRGTRTVRELPPAPG